MILCQDKAGKNLHGMRSVNHFALDVVLYKLTFVWLSRMKSFNVSLRRSNFNTHGIWEASGVSKRTVKTLWGE